MKRTLSTIFTTGVIVIAMAACSSEPDPTETESYRKTEALMEYTWQNLDAEYREMLCLGYKVEDREEVIRAFVGNDPDEDYDGQAIIDFLEANCD